MAPLSLKIILEGGSVTRKVKFDTTMLVADALLILEDKIANGKAGKDYGLFLKSTEDERRGVWLEADRRLDYYMLREGDALDYMTKIRNLKLKMLDGHVKTLQVDESLPVEQIMLTVCQKMGITNHDEYGLCCEGEEVTAEEKAPTGTMTLKRRPPATGAEKDNQLHQLSKKLKTDDNVFWLSPYETLREQCPDSSELVLKRRLFYTDKKVDSRDPVQLSLLYVQVRDAILDGKHPVTLDQAVQFAALQCQVQFGDWNEEKHKPGFFENLREFLPDQFSSSWGVEKDILKGHQKYQGTLELDAKALYIKTARALPTYGVTFFLIKEQLKGKKKLVPRLLGISAESILRLDHDTKDVLQTWPLTQVKSWSARQGSFILNFGDYSDKEYFAKTNDAYRIRDILQAYIDVIKRRQAAPWRRAQLDGDVICEDNVQYSSANLITHMENTAQPQKVQIQTYTGPNSVIKSPPGPQILQGTQTVTTQRVVVVDKATNKTHAVVTSSVSYKHDLNKKLHVINAKAVEIVTLINDGQPYSVHSAAVSNIVKTMKEELPSISSGIAEMSNNEDYKDNQQQLLIPLSQLRDLIDALSNCNDRREVEDLSKETADIAAALYFKLNPDAEGSHDQALLKDIHSSNTANLLKILDKMSYDCAAFVFYIESNPSISSDQLKIKIEDMKKILSNVIVDALVAASNETDQSKCEQVLDHVDMLKQVIARLDNIQDPKEAAEQFRDIATRTERLQFILYPKTTKLKVSDSPHHTEDAVDLEKKLDKLNSNSAKIVSCIKKTPLMEDHKEVNLLIKDMKEDLPTIISALQSAAVSEPDPTKINQLFEQLNKLKYLITTLELNSKEDASEIADRCKKISSCTDKMQFILYPKTKKRVPPPVSLRRDNKPKVVTKLNKLNSNSLIIVSLLAQNLNEVNSEEIKNTVKTMTEDLKDFVNDAEKEANKFPDDAKRKQLLMQLNELRIALAALDKCCAMDKINADEIEEQCTKVAQLSTTLSFELDPACRRRSAMLRKSRQSFIEDDKALATIHHGQLICAVTDMKTVLDQTKQLLDKPGNVTPLKSKEDIYKLEMATADRISDLNAALAKFLLSFSDVKNIDYATAKDSINTAKELIPALIKDMLTLTGSDSGKFNKEQMWIELTQLQEALGMLCRGSEDMEQEIMHEAAIKFANSSANLMYAVGRKTNAAKEDEIITLSKAACDEMSVLLTRVKELSVRVGGAGADVLDAAGVDAAHAARALLAVAQMTSPSISSAHCQNALTSAIVALASSNKNLAKECSKMADDGVTTDGLMTSTGAVATALEKLKLAYSKLNESNADIDIDIREIDAENSQNSVKEDELVNNCTFEEVESRMLKTAIGDYILTLERDQEAFAEAKDEDVVLDVIKVIDLQQELRNNIAKAAVTVNSILECKHQGTVPDKALLETLKALTTSIVRDTNSISYVEDEKSAQKLFDALKSLLEATKLFCAGILDKSADMNLLSVNFGTSAAKLLYVINSETDFDSENKVISHVRQLGNMTSELVQAVCSHAARGEGGGEVARGELLPACDAGGDTCTKASNMLYTAKLMSPTISYPLCQQVLTSSFEDLSSSLQLWKKTWSPLHSDPHHSLAVKEFDAKADAIQNLIESFDLNDTEAKKLMKMEELPLLELAVKIRDHAEATVSPSNASPEQHQRTTEYVRRLTRAIAELKRVNALCQRSPHDKNLRTELEKAVFNLQQSLLQTRPGVQDAGCIVDLTDYINNLSEQANMFNDALKETKVAKEKSTLLELQEKMASVLEYKNLYDRNMQLFMEEEGEQSSGYASSNGIPIIDNYARLSENEINNINNIISKINDTNVKTTLQNKMAPLLESSLLLSFATKSALATERGAAFDVVLHELATLKNQIPDLMKATENVKRPAFERARIYPCTLPVVRAACSLAGAGGGVGEGEREGTRALLAFVAAVRSHTDLQDGALVEKRVKELQDLVSGFETFTMDLSRRNVTFRPAIDKYNQPLLYDLIMMSSCAGVDAVVDKGKPEIMCKLLMPLDTFEEGAKKDEKTLQKDLHRTASKLNATAELLKLNIGKQSSERSMVTLVDVARQLAGISNCIKTKDQFHNNANAANDEMIFVTYKLLKAAEEYGRDPRYNERKFTEVAQELNYAVYKLVNTLTPPGDLELTCSELVRLLRAGSGTHPHCSYQHCLDQCQQHLDYINRIREDGVTWSKLPEHLRNVALAVRDTVGLANESAYLISISPNNKELATNGFEEIRKIKKMAASIRNNCLQLIREDLAQCRDRKLKVSAEVNELVSFITSDSEANNTIIEKFILSCNIPHENKKKTIDQLYKEAVFATGVLGDLMKETQDKKKLDSYCLELVDVTSALECVFDDSLMPAPKSLTADIKKMTDDISSHSDSLLSSTVSWLKEASSCQRDDVTWVVFGNSWTRLRQTLHNLVAALRDNGQRAHVIKSDEADGVKAEEAEEKNGLDVQMCKATKWLNGSTNPKTITEGRDAVLNMIQIASTVTEDLPQEESEELQYLVAETQLILNKEKILPTDTYNPLDVVKELHKALERAVLFQVVDAFLDEPVHDILDVVQEQDESKRKLLLEQKIAELSAHLARVTRTARVVGLTRTNEAQISNCANQAELMAPKLVESAQRLVIKPNEKKFREEFEELQKKYKTTLELIQKHCDDSLDPLEFSQTVGDVVQKLRENSSTTKRNMKSGRISFIISRLAYRVVNLGLKSEVARADKDLVQSLLETKKKIETQKGSHDNIDNMLRVISEMESVFGGENIFKNQPAPDQPIFVAAHSLHACVREWSARDNELVRVARRMAVLVARLQAHMDNCNKSELVSTSKSLVSESHEVARLARLLAHECTDLRIRRNLLQVCDRLPTISGQLKMLTTVKGNTFGKQDTKEDEEAMNTLVGNAQNLMSSVHDIVKNAMSATVKIQSQYGGARIKWVKKQY